MNISSENQGAAARKVMAVAGLYTQLWGGISGMTVCWSLMCSKKEWAGIRCSFPGRERIALMSPTQFSNFRSTNSVGCNTTGHIAPKAVLQPNKNLIPWPVDSWNTKMLTVRALLEISTLGAQEVGPWAVFRLWKVIRPLRSLWETHLNLTIITCGFSHVKSKAL